MDFLRNLINIFLHLDQFLGNNFASYGAWTYAILFVVIFMETGLVVTPFLPGDSLLFAAGAFASLGMINIFILTGLLMVAAVGGDTVNYWIGHRIGVKVYTSNSRWIKKEYLDRTQAFFRKHGGKTIFLARFVPIIRTFAPFVAGVGQMPYGYFLSYNIFGGILWVALFTLAGFFFGNIPFIKHNFSLVILGIVVISFIPAVVEYFNSRKQVRTDVAQTPEKE